MLAAVRGSCVIGKAWMAKEFIRANERRTQTRFVTALKGGSLKFEPPVDFKQRTLQAIGLIRTDDTTPYANMILEPA